MKQSIAILLLIATIASNGFAEEQKRDLIKTAEFFAKSYLAKDYETCSKMMDPNLVKHIGGEEFLAQQLEEYRNLIGQNTTIKSIEILSKDKRIATIKNEEYAVIPYLMTMISEGGEEFYYEGYYFANSRVDFPIWWIQNGGSDVKNSIKQYSEDLYNKLEFPQMKSYNKDKSFLMIQENGEWVSSEKTYDMMKKILEDAEAE